LYACTIPEKPISKEEAMEFSHKIEKSIARRNPVLLDRIFDEQGFAKRVVSEASRPLDKGLMEGAVEGIRKAQFGQQIVQALGTNGTYQLVKQYEKDNRQHLLFRLYGNGRVNYHDYELVKRTEDIKAIDIYIYMSGENLSKTLAQVLMMMQDNMSDMSKGDLEKVNKIKTIKTLIAQRDFTKAGEDYDQLPADFKKQKLFQLIHIQIGEGMGNDSYAEALNEYKALFPNDPNMYLLMVDAYVLQKDYPKALEAVNKLDSLINKDPFQDYYRGLMYKLMQDTAQSLACFERLHAYMPAFSKGMIELIAAYTRAGDMNEAVQLVRQVKADKSLSPETIEMLFTLHPDLQKAVEAYR
jgi:tetratricopeptide (TPR) repeat protein